MTVVVTLHAQILEQFGGREQELLRALYTKYDLGAPPELETIADLVSRGSTDGAKKGSSKKQSLSRAKSVV